MATFTMYLKRAIELKPDNVSRDSFLGLDLYPIHDELHRPVLNDLIVNHYYNQEIGMETIQLFQFAMMRRMMEVMPFYNQMYKSVALTYNPLITVDLVSDTTGTATNTNGSTSNVTGTSGTVSGTTSESTSRGISSEFPQNMLSGSGDYADSGTDSTAGGKVDATGTENSVSASVNSDTGRNDNSGQSRTLGMSGNQADLVMAQRATFMNIDMLIIANLDDCFMGVWSNGDELLPPNYSGGFYY